MKITGPFCGVSLILGSPNVLSHSGSGFASLAGILEATLNFSNCSLLGQDFSFQFVKMVVITLITSLKVSEASPLFSL